MSLVADGPPLRDAPFARGAAALAAGTTLPEGARTMDRLLLECLACEHVTKAADAMTNCRCGRSAAWYRDGVLEIHGPARALALVDPIQDPHGTRWSRIDDPAEVQRAMVQPLV